MPNQRRLLCVWSVASLLSFSSFAAPVHLTDASAQNAPVALDTPIRQMWDEQNHLATSLEAAGLLPVSDDHHGDTYHDHGDGIGGNYEPPMGVLAGDSIAADLSEMSEQAQRRADSLEQMSAALSMGTETPLNLGELLAIEPVANARVTSNFGYRRMGGRGEYHPGIDLAAPTGTPIYATGTGVVVYAGWKNGYGNFVEIDHGNGFTTRYGHASRILVSVGDQVTKNQEIAKVGSTGRSTGPHLHYEVLRNGQRQDPATYLALAPRRDE